MAYFIPAQWKKTEKNWQNIKIRRLRKCGTVAFVYIFKIRSQIRSPTLERLSTGRKSGRIFFSSMPMMTASFSVLLFSIYTQVVTRIYIFHLQVYLRHVTTDAKKSFTFLGCHSKKSRRVIQCDLENSFAKKFEKFAKQLSFRNECKFPRPRTCFKPIIFQFLPVKTLLL